VGVQLRYAREQPSLARSCLKAARGPRNLNLVPYHEAYWQWKRNHEMEVDDDEVEFLCHIVRNVSVDDSPCLDLACSIHGNGRGFGDWRPTPHKGRQGDRFPGAGTF
jgi:hypothetical protein